MDIFQNIKDKAKETARQNSSWTERAGRIGFAARGFVYILIGILAFSGAVSRGQIETGSQSAFEQIIELPYGKLLLVIVMIGLICHAIWRIIQAFIDTDNKGSKAKGYLIRTGFFGIGLIYFGLAFSALKILLGANPQNEFWAESWTEMLLNQPFGQWFVAIIGAIIIGIGFYQFFRAFSKSFQDNLVNQIEKDVRDVGTYIARYGLIARGIVFTLIGCFFIFAAWNSNAGKTRDFGSTLHFIEQQPYGIWLLILIAVGLIAYGIFMLFLARYREMVSK